DLVPNGYTRISLVADWIKEQICLLSQDPPADCPQPPQPDPSAVELNLVFIHDFYADETTYSIRNKVNGEVVYTGPEYVPERNGQWRVSILLPPGAYAFELYDKRENGLNSNGRGFGDGRWRISALYDGTTSTELASGGPDFRKSQITDFVVEDRSNTEPEIVKNSLGRDSVKIGASTIGGAPDRKRRSGGGGRRVRGIKATQLSPEPRIIDGTRMDPSEATFFAKSAGNRLCGAALIHSDILVAAAHCEGAVIMVYDPDSNDFTRRVTIVKQTRHPLWLFNPSAWNFDVLVMRLGSPITNAQGPVPIAFNQNDNFPAQDEKLNALGFGVTEEGGSSKYLRSAEMDYISNAECLERMNTF
ncbi:MAG: hypothetical protein SGARI_005984, partial [Bacillariaceae sp.]